MMRTNKETLKYKLGQKVIWKDKDGAIHHGTVTNVEFTGIEVAIERCAVEIRKVAFEDVIDKCNEKE